MKKHCGKIVNKKKNWVGHVLEGDGLLRRDAGKNGEQENERKKEDEYVERIDERWIQVNEEKHPEQRGMEGVGLMDLPVDRALLTTTMMMTTSM